MLNWATAIVPMKAPDNAEQTNGQPGKAPDDAVQYPKSMSPSVQRRQMVYNSKRVYKISS
eukprot:6924238-Prorocentrum_lima.AAC.1